jgi:hypothetical protein
VRRKKTSREQNTTNGGFALHRLKSWLDKPALLAPPDRRLLLGATELISSLSQPSELPDAKGLKPEKFALFLLKAAAEIEHSLLVQYLYAAYSVNDRKDAGEANPALDWKTTIRLVAREEMAHLATVQNLLLLLGAAPYLDRPHIHQTEANLPLPFKLERLSIRSLAKYLIFESPSADIEHNNPEIKSVLDEARSLVQQQGRVRIGRVGVLYSVLYWLFLESDDPGPNSPFEPHEVTSFVAKYKRGFHLPNDLFKDSTAISSRMANAVEWSVYEKNMRVGESSPRNRALSALLWIMSQGEGPMIVEESHFYRFARIFRHFKMMGVKADDLIYSVPDNPFVKSAGRGATLQGTPILNPRLMQWAEMLNIRYRLMLLNIFGAMASPRTTEGMKRQTETSLATDEMILVARIGEALPQMPTGRNEARGAAPFHTEPIPKTAAGRARLIQRLREESVQLVAALYKNLRISEDPIVALEKSLLEDIAKQDDKTTAFFA